MASLLKWSVQNGDLEKVKQAFMQPGVSMIKYLDNSICK